MLRDIFCLVLGAAVGVAGMDSKYDNEGEVSSDKLNAALAKCRTAGGNLVITANTPRKVSVQCQPSSVPFVPFIHPLKRKDV